MLKKYSIFLVGALVLGLWTGVAQAYTANKVWFEFRPGGIYRVHVNYTVPELKEFRNSFVEFRNRKKAEKYYWDLVKGGDFYNPSPESIRFVNTPADVAPDPW